MIKIKVKEINDEEEEALEKLLEIKKKRKTGKYRLPTFKERTFFDEKTGFRRTIKESWKGRSGGITKKFLPFFSLWRKGIIKMEWKKRGHNRFSYAPVFYIPKKNEEEIRDYLSGKKDEIEIQYSDKEAKFLEDAYKEWEKFKKKKLPKEVEVNVAGVKEKREVAEWESGWNEEKKVEMLLPIEIIANKMGVDREEAIKIALSLYRKGQLKVIRGYRPWAENLSNVLKEEELSYLPELTKRDIELWVKEEKRNLEVLEKARRGEKLNKFEQKLMQDYFRLRQDYFGAYSPKDIPFKERRVQSRLSRAKWILDNINENSNKKEILTLFNKANLPLDKKELDERIAEETIKGKLAPGGQKKKYQRAHRKTFKTPFETVYQLAKRFSRYSMPAEVSLEGREKRLRKLINEFKKNKRQKEVMNKRRKRRQLKR